VAFVVWDCAGINDGIETEIKKGEEPGLLPSCVLMSLLLQRLHRGVAQCIGRRDDDARGIETNHA
jgi:hypothetical protein